MDMFRFVNCSDRMGLRITIFPQLISAGIIDINIIYLDPDLDVIFGLSISLNRFLIAIKTFNVNT